MFFVKKKDSSLIVCIDYSKMYKVTINKNYTIWTIDDLFDQLKGDSHFSNIDLKSCYHQLKIRYCDIPKTTLRFQYGVYELAVMLFGLINAHATLMDMMNKVFKQYLDLFVIVFIDNIFIHSRNEEEHMNHFRVVLQTLKNS